MRQRLIFPALLLVIVLIVGSRLSNSFLDFAYLRESATLSVEIGLIALAMTYVIASGNIDLSVASNLVLTSCLTAKIMQAGTPPAAAMACGVVIGTALGYLNGWLVTKFKVPSFLITVATMAIYRGIAQALLGSNSVKIPDAVKGIDTLTFIGLTIPLVLLLASTVIGHLGLEKTVLGKWVLALGSNPRTSLFSGVPTDKVTRSVFAISGLACGLGAMLMLSRFGLARHDLAKGWELDAITMVVVGGTSIRGGDANIVGTLFAFLLIALMKSAMGVANISAEYQMTAIGLLLIFSVLINRNQLKLRKS